MPERTEEPVGTITGEYEDGDRWVATLNADGTWACEDENVATLLKAFDPKRYSGPPFPFGVPTLHEAAKELHAVAKLTREMVELPPGTVY